MQWINQEVEHRLLSTILLQPDVWHDISADFRPEAFAYEEYRTIASIIKGIVDKGENPTSTKIYIESRKKGIDSKEILSLENAAVRSETKHLNKMLIDLWRKRTALDRLKEAVYTIEQSDKSTDEVIAVAQDALIKAFSEDRKDVVSWGDVLSEVHENQLLAQEGQLDEAIPVGVEALDGLLRLIRGRQVVLAARPSMGKSALAMNVIKEVVKRGRRALLFTPEQEDKEFAQRSLSAELDIPMHMFGQKMDDYYIDKLNTGLTKVHDWPLRIMDRPKPKIEQIKTIARAEKSRYPDLDLMVVDYLGECDVEEAKYGGLQAATGRAISQLRGLAKELGIAQIIVSQLSRKLEHRDDKRPTMADLRETGRIEEVADTIIFLYRHGYYNENFMGTFETPCTYGDWITEVHCGKDRQGGSSGRRVIVRLDNRHLRFETLEKRWAVKYQEKIRG